MYDMFQEVPTSLSRASYGVHCAPKIKTKNMKKRKRKRKRKWTRLLSEPSIPTTYGHVVPRWIAVQDSMMAQIVRHLML
jgi:hypothetical protein